MDQSTPANDHVLAELTMTRGRTVQLTAVGTLGFVVATAAFAAVYQAVTGEPAGFQFAPDVGWWTSALYLLALAVLSLLFIPLHEWLHGLAIRYYGGEPSYGVGVAHFVLPYAYATTDYEFTRDQFVVVLLTPLVAITAVATPAMVVLGWGWLVIPLAANAAGAVVDVWMALTLTNYPSHVLVQDYRDGVRVLGREGDRARSISIATFAWNALAGGAVAVFAILIVVAIAGPTLLSALGVDSFTLGRPGTFTYVFRYVYSPTEISLGVGPGVVSLGALVGIAYSLGATSAGRGEARRFFRRDRERRPWHTSFPAPTGATGFRARSPTRPPTVSTCGISAATASS
ncbi:DUF3267 domain-containing protein [Halosegnis longus]|uniref:DUF3267 domain-containing protein n=1 Tax=Halosegnis longus TaxID=2216012 RepID=A0AAJ4R958_9EURY|nr:MULTISPECIES: DUF3267 domain-containing protein [Halobacteriales]RNJ26447.1 DUF3267 domain-containing protein [Salella cibi]